MIAALEAQLDAVDVELRRFARSRHRCQALQSIYGIGPILACHLLAEIGEACRFRRAEQITRLAGLDPSSTSPATPAARQTRQGRLATPALGTRRGGRARAPTNRPRHRSLPRHPRAAHTTVARLTVARKIGKRAYHALRELDRQLGILD